MTQAFAPLYHAHHCLNQEDLPFWLGLARAEVDPILELGCGTGRLLTALAQVGRQVVGLDHDLSMLDFLRRVLLQQDWSAALAGQVGLLCADFTRFRLRQRFGMVFLACNTYSTLGSTERLALLQCVTEHLLPGGLFAASLPNPEVLRRLPSRGDPEVEEVFPHPEDGEPVQVSSAWQRTGHEFRLTWYYDHLLPDGGVERLEVETRHLLDGVSVHLAELSQAGFGQVTCLGDYDGLPWVAESPALILLARKEPRQQAERLPGLSAPD